MLQIVDRDQKHVRSGGSTVVSQALQRCAHNSLGGHEHYQCGAGRARAGGQSSHAGVLGNAQLRDARSVHDLDGTLRCRKQTLHPQLPRVRVEDRERWGGVGGPIEDQGGTHSNRGLAPRLGVDRAQARRGAGCGEGRRVIHRIHEDAHPAHPGVVKALAIIRSDGEVVVPAKPVVRAVDDGARDFGYEVEVSDEGHRGAGAQDGRAPRRARKVAVEHGKRDRDVAAGVDVGDIDVETLEGDVFVGPQHVRKEDHRGVVHRDDVEWYHQRSVGAQPSDNVAGVAQVVGQNGHVLHPGVGAVVGVGVWDILQADQRGIDHGLGVVVVHRAATGLHHCACRHWSEEAALRDRDG
eukprot:RCo009777